MSSKKYTGNRGIGEELMLIAAENEDGLLLYRYDEIDNTYVNIINDKVETV